MINELETELIGKLLKKFAFPAIIAMIASSLYNMVDSIFIGQGCGPMAISGLAVTFPLMNLSTAFGTLVGAGASALISILLGKKKFFMANRVLGNIVLLNVIIGGVFAIVTLIFIDPILYFFGASEQTLPYAKEYIVIILWGNIITHLYFGLNAALRAAGFPRQAMVATIFTVVINTILDPLFIFVLDMGIKGAAIATILSQTLSLIWILKLFSRKDEILHFTKTSFHFNFGIARQSLIVGMAPFLMNLAACVVVIFVNNQLQKHGGDLAIGAYGISNRIAFLFIMIVMGFTQGMQPIAGYNYGARKYSRVKEVLGKTIVCGTATTMVGFLIAMFCPRLVSSLFTSDEELLELSVKSLRVMLAAFPIVGFQIVVGNFLQSIRHVKKAILLSLSRQLIFLIPLLVILPYYWGTAGVFLAMPISDFFSFLLALFTIRKMMKNFGRQERKV